MIKEVSFSMPMSALMESRKVLVVEVHRYDWKHPQSIVLRPSPVLFPILFKGVIRVVKEAK